jgi:hypothetical protein
VCSGVKRSPRYSPYEEAAAKPLSQTLPYSTVVRSSNLKEAEKSLLGLLAKIKCKKLKVWIFM